MRVEVLDAIGRQPRILEGQRHHPPHAVAVFGRRRQMVRVGAHPVPDQLGQDRRAAALGHRALFQHEDARTFADDEAVAAGVPGTAGAFGRVVARGQRAHGGKAGDAQRRDAGLGAAADHRVGVAALHQAEPVADGVSAGGARRRHGRVGALGAKAHRDLSGRQVHDRRENEERRDALGALLEQHAMFALDHLEAADAAADDDAHARGVVGPHDQAAGREGDVGGRDGELDEAPALLDVLAVDPPQRVEPFHLAGKSRGVAGGVKQRDRRDPGSSGEDALPRLVGADAERRDQPNAGHDHAPKAG